MIPLSRPHIGEAEEQAVIEVLRSGMIAMGDRTHRFEEAWARYSGARHAVFMSNGTVALEAILRGLGIADGDEVVTVSFTFNATVSAIISAGARPVFVDVRDDDYCMDARLVEAAITKRTRAILPVHLYGLMADMGPLGEIARRYGLTIIQDAAQAAGATYEGREVGRFGPAMYSLYATKNITSGEGGMATTDDDELAHELRLYRNHGMRERYRHEALGTNLKPTDIGAAIGLAQLSKDPERTTRRRENARLLAAGLEGYLTPMVPDGREHVWHQFTLRFPDDRDGVARRLRDRGVGTMVYYPVPVHRQPYLRHMLAGSERLDLPVTDRLASEVLSIPVRADLTRDEIEQIIDHVREAAPMPVDTSAVTDRSGT
jgi:dTDP-4-amino-4,6-dideoxygalactose transaminase